MTGSRRRAYGERKREPIMVTVMRVYEWFNEWVESITCGGKNERMLMVEGEKREEGGEKEK